MTLGQTIQAYRKRAALSQEALAERVGVSRQAVSKWELDEATPEISKLKALAVVFGITVDQLLSGELPTPPSGEEPAEEATAAREPSKAESLLNALPNFLGKLFRKYGWLAGIYIALSGLGTTVAGWLMRRIYLSFFGALGGGITGLGAGWSVSATDRLGNPLSLSQLQQLMGSSV